jgi:dihydroflavonol-4-reductase
MIAVTGANGLLGSFIVRQLLSTQQPFVAVVRRNSDVRLLADIAEQVTFRYADVTDPVSIDEALEGVNGVIHAAAVVSFNPAQEKNIYKINVEGTRNVVDACLERNISRFVHVSSVAALGRQKDQPRITEENKWLESPLNTVYAKSKHLAEAEVFRANEEGLNTVTVSPSVILAPADWTRSSAQLFKYVWEEKKFYIDSNLNFVDVRDVVNAIFQLYNSQINGERFILNGGTIRFQDFFSMVADKFNKKPPSVKLNSAALKLLASVETLRSNLLGKEPLITRETARMAGNHFSYSSDKIKKLLNLNFHSIESTVSWCCSHYLNFIAKK